MFALLGRMGRILTGAIAAVLILFSFGWVIHRALFRNQPRPGQVEIQMIHWGVDDEDAIVQRLVAEFERLNPDIKVRRVNPGQSAAVNTKVQTLFASGDPPDVLQFGYEKVADWSAKGLLMPLDDWIERDIAAGVPDAIRLEDYYTKVMDCFRYDGRQLGVGPLYGVAKDFTTAGVYYNKTLFAKAGVEPPHPDWTWDDFIEKCRQIARLPGCYGAEFVTWEAQIRLYLWTEGVDFASPTFDEFYFDNPDLIAALARLRGWFHDPSEQRTFFSAKTQLETGEDLFLTGRVGMCGALGRWKVPTFRLIKDFDWDFAPLPRGRQRANAIFTSAWAIARDAKHPEEAWRLVRFLSSRHGQELACELGLAIPTMKSVAQSPAFLTPHEKPKNDQAYLDMIPYSRTIDWPEDPRYLQSARTVMEALLKTGQFTAASAMQRLDQVWSAIRADQPVRRAIPWTVLGWVIGLPAGLGLILGGMYWWRSRPGPHALQEELAGLGMISPWLIGFAVFTAFPVLASLLLTFTDWSGMSALARANWVGWSNVLGLAHDPTFHKSLAITALYVALAVPAGQFVALGAALLLNRDVKASGFFRSAWYLPSVLAGVGIAILWKWVFDDEAGLLNQLLAPLWAVGTRVVSWFGYEIGHWRNIGWLEKDAEQFAVPAFVIISLWSIGGSMIIYLAGLKGIPADLYEAAAIDGARVGRRFWNVTLPMLSPVIFFNVIIAIIASFQVFTQAYVMTGGGPGDATRFYVMYLYNQAFDNHQMGSASAMAWLLLIIVLALTLLVMWGSRRFVYYEALKS